MNLSPMLTHMRRFAPWALVLASAAAAVAAYLQALNFPFVSDDKLYLTENTKLAGLRLSELWRFFVEPSSVFSEFLPLRDLSFWIDITLFGLNPAAFRLHNILLYLLCLPLLYAVTLQLWRYFRPLDAAGAPWAAAAVTALFALHPALVESVVWVSGRKYVLPNLFALLALWLAVHARRERGLSAPHAAAALAAFAAAMLSKSSYVTVAPVIALLWVMFWRDIPVSDRRRSQLLWPLAIVLVAEVQFVIFMVVSGGAGATKMPLYFGIEAVTRTLSVLGSLLRLAVSPESRHLFYPGFEDVYLPAMVALGAAVLVAAAVGLVMALRKRSLEGFALTAFLLLCLPYIQLIPYLGFSLVQDRYLSVAVWPVLLLLAALAWRLKPAPRVALLLAFALPWGYQTIERARDWRSFEALVEADLRAYPGYYMPAMFKIESVQLSKGLHRDAIETANGITDPKLRDLMIAIVKVDHAASVNAIATGKPREAIDMLWQLELYLKQRPVQAKWDPLINFIWVKCRDILEVEWEYLGKRFPDDASVSFNVGLWKLDVHKYKDAATHLRAATESQRLPEALREAAFRGLGFALLHSGQAAAAEAPLRAALAQLPPDFRAYCLLAEVYKQTGRAGDVARAEAECRSRVPNAEAVR